MIKVTGLTKYYGGTKALGPVSFEIADGEAVGFLGLNGAGKTTVLRMLACDLRPSSGSIVMGGIDVVDAPAKIRARIGFLPENPPLYSEMRVREYLRFLGELRGMNDASIDKRIADVLGLVDLANKAEHTIGELSHGQKQRVGVAQAILHNPEFVILDEPTRGLDPLQIIEMRSLVHELKQKHTVLISSHILNEISQTCDRLLVLGKGHVIGSGTEAELSSKESDVRQVTVGVRISDEQRAHVGKLLSDVPGVTATAEPYKQGTAWMFGLSTDRDVRAELARAIVSAGHDMVKLDNARGELESTFVRLVGGTHVSN